MGASRLKILPNLLQLYLAPWSYNLQYYLVSIHLLFVSQRSKLSNDLYTEDTWMEKVLVLWFQKTLL